MNDKVFWSILGALVLGWVGLYFGLVSDVRAQALEAEGKVSSAVKRMKKYEKLDANELPTKKLADHTAAQLDSDKTGLDEALDFFATRDARFGEWITGGPRPDEGTWWAQYKVAFDQLKSEYMAYADIVDPGEMPFKVEKQDGRLDLEVLQQRWRVQETLIRKVMAQNGFVENYEPIKVRGKKDNMKLKKGEKAPRIYHEKLQAKIQFRMPPSNVFAYLDEILTDPSINFEINEFEMAKRERDLMYEKADVVDKDEAANTPYRTEPNCGVELLVDAFDWVYQPEEEN